VSFIQGTNDAATDLYFARRSNEITFEAVERTFAAYRNGIERILGLPAGSFYIVDRAILAQWYG
jgi:hypothetical protein